MIVYLDANIIIYLVENPPHWGPKSLAAITQLRTLGDQITSGDASRLECLVGPYLSGDQMILADYTTFFQAPDLTVFPLTAAVCKRRDRSHPRHQFQSARCPPPSHGR